MKRTHLYCASHDDIYTGIGNPLNPGRVEL
jgi:hypothetical protein